MANGAFRRGSVVPDGRGGMVPDQGRELTGAHTCVVAALCPEPPSEGVHFRHHRDLHLVWKSRFQCDAEPCVRLDEIGIRAASFRVIARCDDAASKPIWLALRNITADWGRAAKEWRSAMNQFAILFEDRVSRQAA